jgi:hypothetical protein
MDEDSNIKPGGFISDSLPSPAPSNASRSSTTSSLPHPRSQPLRAGSAKEEAARRYVESRLLHTSRRYTKKFQPHDASEDVHGYESMSEAAEDLGDVVDVLWLSGTRTSSFPVFRLIVIRVSKYSESTNPIPVECRLICNHISPGFSTCASRHFQAPKKARSRIC